MGKKRNRRKHRRFTCPDQGLVERRYQEIERRLDEALREIIARLEAGVLMASEQASAGAGR